VVEEKTLHLQLVTDARTVPLDVPARRLLCAGFSGRSQDAVQAHVRELAELGMPAPESTPIFINLSHYLASTATGITVFDRLTSGEVEFVLLFHGGETYLTCGSDHTHRELERYSIPGSKQMFPKILAADVWKASDVEDHWDRLVLRSWCTLDGTRRLYQEGDFSQIMRPEALFDEGARRFGNIRQDGTVFMSGTVPTIGGLAYADNLAFELHDPVRNRTIRHAYDVLVLD